jgi:putative transposase
LRDVEDLLAERGLDVSYETVRRWVVRFGPAYALQLQSRRPRPCDTWHLNKMFVSIGGRMTYLWRAVYAEGEALETLVQRRRDKSAALKLMRRLLKRQGFARLLSARSQNARPQKMRQSRVGGWHRATPPSG